MAVTREIIVTLSDELAGHLRGVASKLEVPLEWLVVGIVCDTIDMSPDAVSERAIRLAVR
jgi:hypothetical protein